MFGFSSSGVFSLPSINQPAVQAETSPPPASVAAAKQLEGDWLASANAKYVAMLADIAAGNDVPPATVLRICSSIGKSAVGDLERDLAAYVELQLLRAKIDPARIAELQREHDAALVSLEKAVAAKQDAEQAYRTAGDAEMTAVAAAFAASSRLSDCQRAAALAEQAIRHERFALFVAGGSQLQ